MKVICQNRTGAELSEIRMSDLKNDPSHSPAHIICAGAPAVGTLVSTVLHGSYSELFARDKRRQHDYNQAQVMTTVGDSEHYCSPRPVSSGST